MGEELKRVNNIRKTLEIEYVLWCRNNDKKCRWCYNCDRDYRRTFISEKEVILKKKYKIQDYVFRPMHGFIQAPYVYCQSCGKEIYMDREGLPFLCQECGGVTKCR